MQVLIEISDEAYDWLKNGFPNKEEDGDFAITAIQQGVPLPKEHGELIDRSQLIKTIKYSNSMGGYMAKVVDAVYEYATKIVEAMPVVIDKEKSDVV